jgi:hypothetical protein
MTATLKRYAPEAPDGSAVDAADKAAELRLAFDRSFAQPPLPPAGGFEDLLTVWVAGAGYAIRLGAIAGLYADREVARLPSPVPELLGVAAFRGVIVAVYDLGALLGRPASQAPRWLVLDRGSPAVALAFDGLERHLRVPATEIVDGACVGTPDGLRPLIDLTGVRAAIENRKPPR